MAVKNSKYSYKSSIEDCESVENVEEKVDEKVEEVETDNIVVDDPVVWDSVNCIIIKPQITVDVDISGLETNPAG